MGGKKKKSGKKAPVDAATAGADDSPQADSADAAFDAEKTAEESVQGAAAPEQGASAAGEEPAIVKSGFDEAGNEDVDDEPTAQEASGSAEAAQQFEDEVRSWHVSVGNRTGNQVTNELVRMRRWRAGVCLQVRMQTDAGMMREARSRL